MYKLFQTSHGSLYRAIKNRFRNPSSVTPISHIHNPTDTLDPNSKLGFIFSEVQEQHSSTPPKRSGRLASKAEEQSDRSGPTKRNEQVIQISHPWPEWVDLIEWLIKRGYFDGEGAPFGNGELGTKGANCIRTACLNFARDRYNLIRYLSRKHIHVIAGCGCPSIDRKVVNSGKRLRAHVGIDEGNVCSSCNLRGNCERAYVKAREDEAGRTVDVIRILLTYGLDPLSAGTVENKHCQNKLVKESVRKLLKEMVDYSTKELDSDLPEAATLRGGAPSQDHSISHEKGRISVPMRQGDWTCPKCNFLNFARNIKCLRCDGLFEEKLRQLREDQDHLPLKKGDWICEKCNFLNFAKNTRCLQCQEKPPKRQLNPGEWECDSCNYINFRRNMVCLKCDYRRPKASNASKTSSQPEHDNGGNHRWSGENEAKDLQGQPRRNRHADMWRFVEKESEDSNHSVSWNGGSKFVDFPITGGKSTLSHNIQKREEWKREMIDRSKQDAKQRENNDEFDCGNNQRKLDDLEFADDDEMAEWFGHRKKIDPQGSISVPNQFLD